LETSELVHPKRTAKKHPRGTTESNIYSAIIEDNSFSTLTSLSFAAGSDTAETDKSIKVSNLEDQLKINGILR
jgi:hypothetical protein